jgi:uncharacterized repeat protein (TIGR01451 family)
MQNQETHSATEKRLRLMIDNRISTAVGKTIAVGIASGIVLGTTLHPTIAQAQTAPIFQETFLGGTLTNAAPGTYTVGGTSSATTGDSVCLTATQSQAAAAVRGCAPGSAALPATGDTAGNGALRLTSNQKFPATENAPALIGEKGFFIVNKSLSTTNGLIFEFEYFTYNGQSITTNPDTGNPPGGDGFSFFLIKDNVGNDIPVPLNNAAGAFGGSLGYAQRDNPNTPGLPNAYLGIGFDDFGNFSNSGEARNGGNAPGVVTPNRIVLRDGADNNYAFLQSVNPGGNLSDIASNTTPVTGRGPAQSRRGRITITPANLLSVELDFTGTGNSFQPVITNFNLAGNGQVLPPFFKFGFAASTGTSTAIHEIRNLTVRPITAPPVPPTPPAPPPPPPTPPPVQNFRLVKRVTAITRSGLRTNFNTFVDDPASTEDNIAGWSQLTGGLAGLTRVPNSDRIQTGDEVEYTIYYLAEGNATLVDSKICDQIPEGSRLIPNTVQVSQNNLPPIAGGNVFNPLQPIVPTDNPCTNQANPNGTVLFNLGDLPITSGNNFGLVRLRTQVN